MNSEAAFGLAVPRIKEGSTSRRVIAELVETGASEETSQEVMDRVLATKRDAQARDVAVSLLEQGSSAADVWERLVSSGVEPAAAEALVTELAEQRRKLDEVGRQAERWADSYEAELKSGSVGLGELKSGSFGWGLVCGCVFSLISLIASFLSSSMGSETKRGVRLGFMIRLGVTLLLLMILLIGSDLR